MSTTKDENIRDLYFENSTRAHQQAVAKLLLAVADKLTRRAIKHDASKLTHAEKPYYVDPVWELNHENVQYGSNEYKRLISAIGQGWENHAARNDHHVEFFLPYSAQTLNDPIRSMNLIALIEMLCDWIAAGERAGNDAALALDQLHKKYPVDEQLQALIRSTLPMIKRWEKEYVE